MPTVWSSHMYYCTVYSAYASSTETLYAVYAGITITSAAITDSKYSVITYTLLLPIQTIHTLPEPHSMGCQTHIYFVSCHHIYNMLPSQNLHMLPPHYTRPDTILYKCCHHIVYSVHFICCQH